MKNKFLIPLTAFVLIFNLAANAQTKTLKIGYTNIEYILNVLPESKQVNSELNTYKAQLDKQYQIKAKEFMEKNAAYERGAATMTEVIRADKERELINLQDEIREFERNAEQSLIKKQESLMSPLLEKVQNAIDQVAEENGYTYIFNSDANFGSVPIILHGPKTDNISDLVFKKLGVTPPASGSK
ncbi:MAG: OmpH family outer membrane protein [Bacteroidetes bacterium]|nr:OmpH family outer membrane protein [Bacteroidota bacterium]